MSDVTRPFGTRGRLPEPPIVPATAPPCAPFDSAPVMTSLLADGARVRGGEIEIEYTMMHGAGGTTYRAHERTSGRVLALKVLEGKYAHTVQAGVRLLAEAKYTALLHGHPNVVPVVDSGYLAEAQGRPYVATEFIEGTTLSTYAERVVPLELKLRLLRDVAAVVADLHAVGVVHRDVKPDNVLVTPASAGPLRARLTDFGYATTVAGVAAVAVELTAEHERPGTKHYMAPEQCMGYAPTPAFDVYALGVTAFELLTGAPPMATASEREVVLRKCDPQQPGFSLVRAGMRELPVSLVRLVDRALLFEPMLRQSAAEFRDGLDRVLLELGTAGAVDIDDDGATEAVPRTHTEVIRQGHVPRPPAVVLAPEAVARTGTTVIVETERVPEPVNEGSLLSERADAASLVTTRRWPWAVLGLGAVAAIVVWAGWPKPARERDGSTPAAAVSIPAPHVAAAGLEPPPGRPPAPPAIPSTPAPASEDVAPTPSPSPPIAPPSKPKPRPSPAQTPEHETAACTDLRDQVTDAQERRDWAKVLQLTRRATCWKNSNDRRVARIHALAGSGRFDACVSEADRARIPTSIADVVAYCREKSTQK